MILSVPYWEAPGDVFLDQLVKVMSASFLYCKVFIFFHFQI